MYVSLSSKPLRVLFASACLGAAGLYVGGVGKHYLAFRAGSQLKPASLERAARLEPWNADPRWQLGRYSLFVAQDAGRASARLEEAVALNPHVARYWLDLAAASQVAGNVPQQRSALERALQAEPTAPDVAWEAANFYLIENDVARALALFRVVMANDPEQLNAALSLCWRATGDVNVMLAEALPARPQTYFAFLRLLTSEEQTAAAETVWARLTGLHQEFPPAEAFPFLDYLLEKRQTSAAAGVWRQLVASNGELQAYMAPKNLIVNGGLEKDFLNGGFDWRYATSDAVELAVDNLEFHGGNQSLRMVFKGPGMTDPGIYEYVAVQPDTDYHFTAYTKAEDIESASGPRLAVIDAYSGRSYVLTEDSLGTTGWREQAADFRTGAESRLLMVKVTRVPGDPLIKGKFWIDDLRLVQR
jgi:tetratricopeptide (TPR) repeat protein